jgi:integrase/recombinase XerC
MLGQEVKFKRIAERPGIVEYLEKNEIRELFRAIDSAENEHLRKRDKAITAAILYSGLRPSEVLRLKVGDVDLEKQEIVVRVPKNRIPSSCIIPASVLSIWTEWLTFRQKCEFYKTTLEMFLNRDFQTLTYEGIRKRFNAYSTLTGLRVTGTVLRHTLGTHLWRDSGDLLLVKQQMRHRKVDSTLRYVYQDKSHLKKQINKFVV